MQPNNLPQAIAWLIFCIPLSLLAQPANDNCANAITVPIPAGGYGYGTVVVDTVQINTASTQFGEYFAPGVPNGKSVWYQFSLPTTRKVRILLSQNGTTMNANQAGWTLYRTDQCFPGAAEVMDPPIFNIEGFTHACLRKGEYRLQVSADLVANGELIVSFEIGPSTAVETELDFAKHAHDFGVVSGTGTPVSSFEVGCQSVFNGELLCPDTTYTKSTWHVFTTDNLVDILGVTVRELPFNTANTAPRSFGYQLYLGDIRTDSTGLILVDSCHTFTQTSNSNFQPRNYACELMPNTTYSIQLLYQTDYFGSITVDVNEDGTSQTLGPNPPTLPPSHQLGMLNAPGVYPVNDVMSCNAKMSLYSCGTNIPDTVLYGATEYDLNWWATFEVPIEQNMRISIPYVSGSPGLRWRLFSGDAGLDCNLPLYAEGTYLDLPCLPPGKYSVQVLGRSNEQSGPGPYTNLGKGGTLNVEVLQQNANQFGLAIPTSVDLINGGNMLVPGTTYTPAQNFFDCQTTVMPAGDSCGSANDRAMYRVVTIPAEGYLRLSNGVHNRFAYKIFAGNAATSPIVNGVITGLTDQTCCRNLHWGAPVKLCVTPGDYTIVTYGDSTDVNISDSYILSFDTIPPTQYTDPLIPEVLPTLSLANPSVTATPTYFSCADNPLTVLGYAPCGDATKQIYREFYLADSASVNFSHNHTATYASDGQIRHRLFRGRLSTNSLTGLERDCFGGFSMTSCEAMAPGWYTVVTYGDGETFTNPEYCTPERGESIGDRTGFTLNVNPAYPTPNYNTFAKAEQVAGGSPISWLPRPAAGHTAAVPKQDTVYVLGTEYFNCEVDTPFEVGIVSCNPTYTRVTYRVFTLEKDSYVRIHNLDTYYYTGGQSQSRLYLGDITGQLPPYMIQEDCFVDDLETCLSAGTYTLVSFYGNWYTGKSVTPSIYLDSLGVSKYNHASNAYDYGLIPKDGQQYLAAPGAPLDGLGRPQSNDFFFCGTDAYATEPSTGICGIGTQTIPYTSSFVNNPRQTLWYTFEVAGSGNIEVSLFGLTPGKASILPFSVYKVPNNAYPITDSTAAALIFAASNKQVYGCYNYNQSTTIFRDPCATQGTDRYVVIVDNFTHNSYGAQAWPNNQIQVGIRYSNVAGITVQYDHFSQANVISGNPTLTCTSPYTDTTLLSGTFTGCEGNLTCATQDATDQNTCGSKTIWYKFKVESSGVMRVNYTRTDNGTNGYNANEMMLFREVIPGDSTSSGLIPVSLSSQYLNTNPELPGYNYWGQTCYTEGTYYLMFTGCSFPNATVVPRVWLENYPGDFCYDSIAVQIPGPGTFQATGVVNCWTIGEAPGENQPNMDCAGSPIGKKTGWFYINITDTTKMDLDVTLTENTTATSLDVQYRVANGSCDLMTFENCVDDVFITLNLKCRRDSGLWIQVILPDGATGDVTLNVNATPSNDQNCVPPDPFRPSASFDFETDCAGNAVQFTNQSSQGAGLSYLWDFGDGFTSTYINPSHVYAIADTYYVELVVMYDSLADTTIRQVVVFPQPIALFTSPDTVIAGNPVTFLNQSTNVTFYGTQYWTFCGPGFCSADYLNYSGSTPPPVTYDVPGTYQICLVVTNGNCPDQHCKTLVVRTPNYYTGGPYDGLDRIGLSPCDTINVFTGGPYDGFDESRIDSLCEDVGFYFGGPFDGFDEGRIDSLCVEVSFVYGGPYDGADVGRIICEDDTFQSIWSGGRSGVQLAFRDLNCDLPTTIWGGGAASGLVQALLEAGCPEEVFFAGGPFDGHDVSENRDSCTSIPIFVGGPYDGYDAAVSRDSCSLQPFFAGGPYDGFDSNRDDCEPINFFTGGPYDGEENNIITSSGLTITDISVCIGEDAIVNTSGPTTWYYSPGGQAVATNTSSLLVPNANNTMKVYADDQCASDIQSATVHVQDTFALDFAFTATCGTTPALFVNQGLIPGSSLPTVGSSLTSFGPSGGTPGFNQISFSSGNPGVFTGLTNGNLTTSVWTGGNTNPGTVWMQWRYFNARSVDRISFSANPSQTTKKPTEARLYYSTGGPWILAKVFSKNQLNPIQFDSGPFCDTRNKYAQLWKLEFDVEVNNAPAITELQIFANQLTTSAPTVWDYGDGSPLDTTSNPLHAYPGPGNYNVSMWLPDDCGCDNPIQKELEVMPCAILALLDHELTGSLNEEEEIELVWEVHGNFERAFLEKYVDRQWQVQAEASPLNTIWYQFMDRNPFSRIPNLYRIRVEDQGELTYSNHVEIMFERAQPSLTLFPNPIQDRTVNLALRLPSNSNVEILVWNHLGQYLGKVYDEWLQEGKQDLTLDLDSLSEGSYYLRVMINQQPYTLRMLVL